MKKILHIPNYYPPHVGGIEDVCYNIVKAMHAKGYPQKVICFNDKKQTEKDAYEGVEIIRIGIWGKIASQAIALSYRARLKALISEFDPDIVHFHAPNPLAAYALLNVLPRRVKLIVHWHSDIVAQKIIYRLVRPLESGLLSRADTIVATSPDYVAFSKPLQSFIDKVTVIQNIIVPEKFKLTEACGQQVDKIKRENGNKPIVLFVGRHVPYKGLQYLIEAAGMIRQDCVILIGGKGPLTRKLKEANKSRNVKFIGRIPDEELVAYLYAADIFAFPSITKNEAFGVALAEAMYCLTPAVTFEITGSGVNWVNLHGETGLEVENGNSREFAAAINTLLEQNDLRHHLSLKARERVESTFTLNQIADKLEQIYR